MGKPREGDSYREERGGEPKKEGKAKEKESH